jgi:glycosyltransferase involved in cell wall biosynthesis
MGCYGNTGIEAMFSGKPVLGQKRFDEVADAPVIPIDAETLESVLLSLLDDRTDWRRIGAESRDYAMRVHSPQAVARRGAEVIRKVMDESTA